MPYSPYSRTRKFDGKTYGLQMSTYKKANAKAYAEKTRKEGWNFARVVKVEQYGRTVYHVYTRYLGHRLTRRKK